ncbi:FtsX-like permease family protein [Tissierella sp. MB52-C2]|uniref:ABC transporter permease n=1 Tax=Tissierella sp. MB52-C2 TaxID=3070999 RepID=UPI00280C3CD0|nr:FtsX-like permease family protein [Tissierella sp. MB52-C2]WMM26218.1 FtsX-like permease family protein [Tissierella sp. MB52-C2]
MVIFKLAISYMKKQKRKTLALLSSIILSVMLIFSMIVIRDSGYDSQIQEAKNLYGDYQIWFEGIDINKAKALEGDKDVIKIGKVKYFCEIVNKDTGVKLDLNSYDKDFITSLNYKLVGREPIKDGEIVIEKEALNQMGINDYTNKDIDMMLLNKYSDTEDINYIESFNKKFKIVGVLEKPKEYYNSLSNSIGGITSQGFVHENSDFPIKTEDTYKGTILLKSEDNTNKFLQKMEKKLNLSWDYLHENTEVSTAKLLKEMSIMNLENIQNTIIFIFISCLVIYNIFNIILQDMITQIGLMRAIGMSRKKVKLMFIQLGFIYILFGTILGIIFGTILSYFGVRLVYGYSTKLTINYMSIVCSFGVSTLSVSISTIMLIRKAMKLSIVDSIKNSEKYRKKLRRKRVKLSNNIIRTISIRNIWRNKSRTIITMLSITIVGIMFILNFGIKAHVKTNIEEGITGGMFGMSYGTVDKTVSGSFNGTDSLFYKLDEIIIEKINNIKEVSKIEPNFFNSEGHILISKDKISKAYEDELDRKNKLYQESYNNEYPLLIRGYSDEILESRESFIEEGQNLINNAEGRYKKVLLVNNTYSMITNSFESRVIDKVKVGDIITIKIPVYKNGLEKYETIKVQLAGIMDKIYAASQDGNVGVSGAQVIFREEDYRELTGQKYYNKIYVMAEKGKLNRVEEELEKLTNKYAFSTIGGKGEDQKVVGAQQTSEEKLSLIYQCLILLILSVNSIFIMRSNIISRKKEIGVLRAIGMSLKDINKTLIIEGEYYGVVASFIGSIIAIINYNMGIARANKSLIKGGFARTIKHNIPWTQVLILFLIFIFIGFLSVYLSRDRIDGVSISDGIRNID